MTLLTVEGTYRNGQIELAEAPDGVGDGARVLVTFLPGESEDERPRTGEEETREAILARIFEGMERGIDLGGPPYPKREELYDRLRRFDKSDG
jgi:hypothetical protein